MSEREEFYSTAGRIAAAIEWLEHAQDIYRGRESEDYGQELFNAIHLMLGALEDLEKRTRGKGNKSRPMEDNAKLRAQRIRQARAILAYTPRISAEQLGEIIGAPKTVALTIRREIQAEVRGALEAAGEAEREQPEATQ